MTAARTQTLNLKLIK